MPFQLDHEPKNFSISTGPASRRASDCLERSLDASSICFAASPESAAAWVTPAILLETSFVPSDKLRKESSGENCYPCQWAKLLPMSAVAQGERDGSS